MSIGQKVWHDEKHRHEMEESVMLLELGLQVFPWDLQQHGRLLDPGGEWGQLSLYLAITG